MHAQQQHMLVLGQAQQSASDQRTVGEVEAGAGFAEGVQAGGAFRCRVAAQVDPLQGQFARCGDDLHRDVVHAGEVGAQGFVTRHDAIQRTGQRLHVQAAAQAHAAVHDVGRAGTRIELVQEPQALLGERQRHRGGARHRQDRWQSGGARLSQDLGQLSQARLGEQRGQRQFQAERAADARDQAHAKQGVAAKCEEAVVAADAFDAKQLAPQRGQQRFQLAFGGRIGLDGERIGIGCRQSAAIELAIGGQWQGVESHVCSR